MVRDARFHTMKKQTPALSARELRDVLRVVMPALEAAGRITTGRQRRVAIQRKLDGSEVTAADRAAERLLRQRLLGSWPRDSFLGEEYGGDIATHGRSWLVDPIDGTASYVLGLGTYGTLLALLVDGTPVFGCIHLPAMGETTYAATGHGCWLRRDGGRPRRVHVAAPRPFTQASTGLTSYKQTDLYRPAGRWRISELIRSIGRVRLVGDCVQYALLCRGELDAAIDPRMSAWDIAALVVCVREAGGTVSDFAGRTDGLLGASTLVAASHPALRRTICARLAPT
jgi:histidinol-phosphatase